MNTTEEQVSFSDHYQSLKEAADQLQGMSEPDVDRILPLVNQGLLAYKGVKSRIDSVRLALQEIIDIDKK